MVQRAMKFTPECLITAPRRSPGLPNSAGDTVLHTTSTYDLKSHKKDSEFRVLDIKTGAGLVIESERDVSAFQWLDDDRFVYLCSEKDGRTSVCIGESWDRVAGTQSSKASYAAGSIDAPAADLKVTELDDEGNEFAVVFSAQASPEGHLFNPEKASATHSTGRLYTSLYVRHWDRYETKEKNSLFYAKLSIDGESGQFKLSKPVNALRGAGLESPIPVFGGTDNFDICHSCIMFIAKDPDLNPALNTKTNVYVLPIKDWEHGISAEVRRVLIPGFQGASTSPVISPDGKRAAFLSMKANGYEADKNQIFVINNLNEKWDSSQWELTPKRAFSANDKNSEGSWDRSPSSLTFSADGEFILATAEDFGYARLFRLKSDLSDASEPRVLTGKGSVLDVQPLNNGTIFISAATLVDNSLFAVIDPLLPPEQAGKPDDLVTWSNSNSSQGNRFGLHYGQISLIWTPASNKKIVKEIQSWVVRPSNFDSSKKYPVAYFIHGGPQGSWSDTWSTRWNPAVFAEQGYIVVAPNPTGSTGFGQAFTDSIRHNWGGDPYQDIVNLFEWVGENLPEADNDRAVALGASFGGYMMNWIQGHELGRKFKALVCHDGVLTMSGMLATEELYFVFTDFGGTPWYDPFGAQGSSGPAAEAQRNFGACTFTDWRRWDPSEHFSNWSTPQLIIHSSKDYRICIADGLSAFNVLQARGIDSQFLTFPDENHFVAKPENSLAWHKVVLNWINRYVGLPPYTEDDPNSDEFWGGKREGNQEVVEMAGQGKGET